MEKNNRLIITGNGFDIAHGLKTRYSDFIDWLLCSSYKVYTEKHYYEDDGLCFGSQHSGMLHRTNKAKEVNAAAIFELMGTQPGSFTIKNNFLSSLLSRQHQEKKWVDIESLYFTTLLSKFQHFNFSYPHHEPQKENVQNAVSELHKELEYVTSKLGEYLKTVNDKISDQTFKYNPRLNITRVLAPDSDCKTMYLNFNYTDTLLEKSYGDESEINYIHGRLGDPDNPIVFGYGDESTEEIERLEHLGVNEFLRKLKSFAYLRTPNYKNLLSFIDAGIFEVHIIGHSCGITDRALLKEIFEHPNCKEISVFFYQRADGSDSFEESTIQISRHFSNKQIMRRKVRDKHQLDVIPQFNL
ncbi:MAG TPA: AbiH family protein [Niabella sp.]|nr:AbiH family protein [Niabella sp.]